MEHEADSRRTQLVRMDDQDRVSQTSSVATISYFPVIKEGNGKVQTFGKRCHAAKRDPNCPVIIRGWLNKKDSAGLKLWKRRWFVLSNYCLFYYKDSREESVLGSIPLPSYKILFCTPRECKNRKFTFKVVHQGMRSYFFSADTQEDMLGWVRALNQSATMEADGSLGRRCSSYQDFTQIGGSSESVDLPKTPSDGEGPSQKHRQISRTLSEPSQLTGGRMGTSHSEHRGRRSVRQRNSRTPSPPDFSRRRICGPNQEEDSLPGQNTPPTQTEMIGAGCLIPRGQLGSRPHTPVGRVDIRPHDDSVMVPQMLYYTPASPKEFKSSPTTPVSERWQNLSKPTPTYGSVYHVSSGRRPLGKSYSTGAHTDLLPPLPPSTRAAHAHHSPQHHHHHHHHHHHRNNLSVCVLPPAMTKSDVRDTPSIRPLENDADAVLTRLCGCDKLLQSLSVELAQLQLDKDSVHCALEVSRLQLEEWKNQGPRAQEEALTQKALLQEELVTIRARMCDVSLEMERVWCQYERMESELSVIRSHLQHICNFGVPQEQSQAQRELWMMEDILAGLKVNRDHFCFLMGLQRHHTFQATTPHPGSPGPPTERLQSGPPTDDEEEPPVRPPLPQELLESHQREDQSHGWTESPYEGIYSQAVDPAQRGGNSQPDLLNVKAPKDSFDSQAGSKWVPPEMTNPSTKKVKMSEEEQIERMKRNQERLNNKKKVGMSAPEAQSQSQGSETGEEAPFPLRVTRVVTAVLPSSLVARRVSVEDPPPELDNPLPEQIPPETQLSKKLLNKPPRRLTLESPEQNRSPAELHQDQAVKKINRQQQQQHQGILRSSKKECHSEGSRAEPRDQAGSGNGGGSLEVGAEERLSALLTPDMDHGLCLTPEQREAKLRRVERIRERVIRSAVRESAATQNPMAVTGEGQEVHQRPTDGARKQRKRSDHDSHHDYGNHGEKIRGSAELQFPIGTSQDEDDKTGYLKKCKSQDKFGNKTQQMDHSGRTAAAKTKVKRPASPYHISSMTVYQRDGAKGFLRCKEDEEQKLDEAAADGNESDFTSSDLRAKWFLSTNQWQGYIPLQIPAIESLCSEETSEIENHTSADDMTDSNNMSFTVSESLEKMKENHALFYKIACDISISDSDITKNDENAQSSHRPDAKDELHITESVPDEELQNTAGSLKEACNDSSLYLASNVNEKSECKDSPFETQEKAAFNTSASPAKMACIYEEIPEKECEVTSSQEGNMVGETIQETPVQDDDCNQALDEKAKQEEEKKKVEQEKPEEQKKSSCLSEENKQTDQERASNHSNIPSSSGCESGRLIRSASFGKARVTVLRTSL